MPSTQTVILAQTVDLTDDDIKALPNAPISFLPAVQDRAYYVVQVIYHFNIIDGYTLSTGEQFGSDSDFLVGYGANQANAVKPLLAADCLAGASDTLIIDLGTCRVSGTIPFSINASTINNKGLSICADSENGIDWIGGNPANAVKVTIVYSIIDLV